MSERRKRFTENMLTYEQKLYLRAGMSHPPKSAEAERFHERFLRAQDTGEPRWLNWAGNISFEKLGELVMHLPYVRDADGETRGSALSRLPDESSTNEAELVPASAPQRDPITDATAIVRSASGEAIDWTREPLTERERKIRRQIIVNTASETILPTLALESLVGWRERRFIASDLRDAIEKTRALENEWRLERERKKLQEAIRQVDEMEQSS